MVSLEKTYYVTQIVAESRRDSSVRNNANALNQPALSPIAQCRCTAGSS